MSIKLETMFVSQQVYMTSCRAFVLKCVQSCGHMSTLVEQMVSSVDRLGSLHQLPACLFFLPEGRAQWEPHTHLLEVSLWAAALQISR